jgi:hypothetical protein
MRGGARLAAKAVLAWLVLFVVMFANGAARVVALQPHLGEDRARQVASLTGLVLVLLVSRRFVRLVPEATSSQLLRVGLGWLTATVAFELVFGRFVSGMSWRALVADYDLPRGRLWSLVLIGVLLGPWLWGARGRRSTVASSS